MSLRQQIIQSRIERIAENFGVSEDMAFLLFTHSIITNQSMHAIDSSDIVDGGQDKQIDAITIEQRSDEATVYIIQAKNTDSFSSNALIQMRNGLEWIFDKARADINTLTNLKLKDKILEYRTVQNDLGPSNIRVVVAYITNGLLSHLKTADEFRQEEKTIRDAYDNGTYANFELVIWGADELVDQVNILEKQGNKIDADIRIIYDKNNPSLIKYYADKLRGLICTASAYEIGRLVNSDPTGSIFDSNIRRFLGTTGNVNKDILKTCSELDVSYQFWFLNNGITIVCESFDPITDQDNPHVRIKNMQIVNGCQTATALALAEKDGTLARDVRVLLRIYQAPTSELTSKIVLTTNNQNKISSHDLHSNDKVQLDMERSFADHKYYYERKPRQYDNQPNINIKFIASNEIVARCYLAVVLKKPSDARAYKHKVWGELYDQIFGGKAIEPYIIAWIIYVYTEEWLKQSGYTKDADDIRRRLATSGRFFIARITSFLWRGGDNWKWEGKSKQDIQQQLLDLEANPQLLLPYIKKAFDLLNQIILDHHHYRSDLEKALKSSALNVDIDRKLYSK